MHWQGLERDGSIERGKDDVRGESLSMIEQGLSAERGAGRGLLDVVTGGGVHGNAAEGVVQRKAEDEVEGAVADERVSSQIPARRRGKEGGELTERSKRRQSQTRRGR